MTCHIKFCYESKDKDIIGCYSIDNYLPIQISFSKEKIHHHPLLSPSSTQKKRKKKMTRKLGLHCCNSQSAPLLRKKNPSLLPELTHFDKSFWFYHPNVERRKEFTCRGEYWAFYFCVKASKKGARSQCSNSLAFVPLVCVVTLEIWYICFFQGYMKFVRHTFLAPPPCTKLERIACKCSHNILS